MSTTSMTIGKLEELIERGEDFRRNSKMIVDVTVDPGVGMFGPQELGAYKQWKASCRLFLEGEFGTSLAEEFFSIEEKSHVYEVNGERAVEPTKLAFERWLDHYLAILKAACEYVRNSAEQDPKRPIGFPVPARNEQVAEQ